MRRGASVAMALAALLLPGTLPAGSALETALSATNLQARTDAVAQLLQAPGASDEIMQQYKASTGARRLKLMVLLCAALDDESLARLTSEAGTESALSGEERECIGAAWIERIRARAVSKTPLPDSLRGQLLATTSLFAAHKDWRVRRTAAELLRELNCAALTPAHRALSSDVSWPVREAALAAVAPVPGGGSILESVLASGTNAWPTERARAVDLMAQIGYEPGLALAARDTDPNVLMSGVRGLMRLPGIGQSSREALAEAQKRVGDPKVRDKIERFLASPTHSVAVEKQ